MVLVYDIWEWDSAADDFKDTAAEYRQIVDDGETLELILYKIRSGGMKSPIENFKFIAGVDYLVDVFLYDSQDDELMGDYEEHTSEWIRGVK